MVLLSVVAGVGKFPGQSGLERKEPPLSVVAFPLGFVIGVYHMARIYHP